MLNSIRAMVLALCALAAVFAFQPGRLAIAAPHIFTKIADSATFDSGYMFSTHTLSINDSGVVAFVANPTFASGGLRILTGDGGGLTNIADVSSLFGSSISLNNSGNVAFTTSIANVQSIMMGNGGTLQTILQASTSLDSFGPAFLNDNGSVAFKARPGGPGGSGQGIFMVSSGNLKTIALNINADSSSPFYSFSDIDINNNSEVTFEAIGSFGSKRIFLGDSNSLPSPIVDTTGILNNILGSHTINNNGDVAFFALLDSGDEAILVANQTGGLTQIATPSLGISGFAGGPAINDSGLVSFVAYLDIGGVAIMKGQNVADDAVISIGDSLFGSVVTDLVRDDATLNNNGQIAFWAELADGRNVIARADPASVPEPAALILFGVGLAGIGITARRRKTH
jgi:hypothetical protein